jgi:hypothetical protein
LARLLLKTHYQAARPGLFSVLISKCASPRESRAKWLLERRLEENWPPSDRPGKRRAAAECLVYLAQRSFGFLAESGIWDWRGRVINALCTYSQARTLDSLLALTTEERVVYLKYYLDADGAALLEMGREVLSADSIAETTLGKQVEEVFLRIWKAYLTIETDVRERVRLRRNVDRVSVHPYEDRTRIHKVRPHLQALADFGLLDIDATPEGVTYHLARNQRPQPLQRLMDSLVDIPSMEHRLRKEQHFAIAAEVLTLHPPDPGAPDGDRVRAAVFDAYRDLIDPGSGLASINAIIDTSCARLLARHGRCPVPRDIRSMLDDLRRERPRDVRFNVDWYGEKAYVTLSDDLLNAASEPTIVTPSK